MRHVLQVWFKPRLGRKTTKPFSKDHQARATQSWPHRKYRLPCRILQINLVGLRCAGPDEAQIATENVPQRGDLVEREIADEATETRRPRRNTGDSSEAIVRKRTAVSTNAGCLSQRNLAKGDEQRESDENADGQQERQENAGANEVKDSSQIHLCCGSTSRAATSFKAA